VLAITVGFLPDPPSAGVPFSRGTPQLDCGRTSTLCSTLRENPH
jgi:hypothetical protein